MAIEDDILGEAVAATEMEIFNAAFGKEGTVLDETGDRSLENMGDGLEGQIEPEDDEGEDDESELEAETGEGEEGSEQVDGKGKAPDKEAAPDPKDAQSQQPEGRVPAGRLREQTEKLKAAETEREALKTQLETERANSRKELDAINAKFDGVLAALQRQQPVQPQTTKAAEPETPPDLFEDPKAFAEYLQKGPQEAIKAIEQRFEEMRIDTSLNVAHAKHGETFSSAYKAFVEAGQRGDAESIAMGKRILASPNPGEALVQWHKRNEVFRRVGDDPTAFEGKIREETKSALMQDPEFRRQLLEELRADATAGDNGRPRTVTRLPRSLNSAAGNGHGIPTDRIGGDGSDQSVFDSVFKT